MKLPAIIVDVDGTVADCSERKHFLEGPKKDWDGFYSGMEKDKSRLTVCAYVNTHLQYPNQTALFVSGRPEKYRSITEDWLSINFGPIFSEKWKLYMRPDGDHRPDYLIKKEIYKRDIEPTYNVFLVLDDRNQVVDMWRGLGIECWQVAAGNF